MVSQNCFPGFCTVSNFFFQTFLFPLAFDSKDVFNLNSKGDLTIKLSNLDLFYKGVPHFCATNLSKFKIARSLKPRANRRNIVGQQLPTLLDVTCCVRLHTVLHVVGCCCAKFETGQTFQPTTPNISFVP